MVARRYDSGAAVKEWRVRRSFGVTVGCLAVMAGFRDIQLNAIEKKMLMKQAEDLYRSTNCKCNTHQPVS